MIRNSLVILGLSAVLLAADEKPETAPDAIVAVVNGRKLPPTK